MELLTFPEIDQDWTLPEENLEELLDFENIVLDPGLCEQNAVLFGSLSFQFFAWYYLRQHLNYQIARFHEELYATLQNLRPGQNGLFLLPRGHGKSTIISFAYTLWHVCYRTKRHIGLISSTAELAKKFLGKIASELRNNELIKRDFGDLSGLDAVGSKEIWTQAKLRTTNQVVLFAMGTGGSVRGLNESLPIDAYQDYLGKDRRGRHLYRNTGSFRPDLLILDDVIEMKWLKTKRVRDQVENWFLTSALPAIDAEQGNAVVVGTTLHSDDLVSRLYLDRVKTAAWIKVKKPACEGFDKRCNPVKPLWPEFWSKADENKPLTSTGLLMPWAEAQQRLQYQEGKGVFYLSHLWWRKVELGSKAFAQEYLLDPLADGMKLIDRAWVRYYITKNTVINSAQEQAILNAGIRLDALPDDLIAVTAVDPASARGKQAVENNSDYSVVSTIGYSPKMRRFYLLDIDRVRTTPAVLMQILLRHYRVFNHQYAGRMYTDKERKNYVDGHPCEHLGILVESVGYQKALAIMLDELAVALGMYPRIIEVKRGKSDKAVRATAVSPLFENGQVYWPCMLLQDQLKQDFEDALYELDHFMEAEHDDCFPPNTLILTERGEIPICEVTTKDRVWTRWGWRRVLRAWCTGTKEVITRFGITATPSHPIWTENRGWVPLVELRFDDIIQTCQTQRQSNGTVSDITVTRNPSVDIFACTTGDIHLIGSLLWLYIAICGNFITGLFQKATKFITRMGILSITRSAISNVSIVTSTGSTIANKPALEVDSPTNSSIWPNCGRNANGSVSFAKNAAKFIGPSAMVEIRFVPVRAAINDMCENTVEKASIEKPEKSTLVETWNLTVDEHPEFVANGVLVHNCVDAIADSLNFLNRMSLSLNRGLAAQVAMREMLRQSPEVYAMVSKLENDGMDMQDALNQYHQRS